MNIIGNVCINHIKEGDEDNEDYSANGSSSDETETGDASHAVFWVLLMTADAVILTLLLRRRRRADSNQPR